MAVAAMDGVIAVQVTAWPVSVCGSRRRLGQAARTRTAATAQFTAASSQKNLTRSGPEKAGAKYKPMVLQRCGTVWP